MTAIIEKHHLKSEANLRPCNWCLKEGKLIQLAEIRCERMLKRPFPGKQTYIRCTNGICKNHDSTLTIMGKTFQHICPSCFLEKIQELG